mmetsp:Transcript_13208/g.41303  ORF Transcript_13208/g.41303 Transcript_13208/m.41303 type:complete len:236 (+) Transcript_13208:331-1038(+)
MSASTAGTSISTLFGSVKPRVGFSMALMLIAAKRASHMDALASTRERACPSVNSDACAATTASGYVGLMLPAVSTSMQKSWKVRIASAPSGAGTSDPSASMHGASSSRTERCLKYKRASADSGGAAASSVAPRDGASLAPRTADRPSSGRSAEVTTSASLARLLIRAVCITKQKSLHSDETSTEGPPTPHAASSSILHCPGAPSDCSRSEPGGGRSRVVASSAPPLVMGRVTALR